MSEFHAGAHRYRARPMCAFEQWGLLARLKPILPALYGIDHGLSLADAGLNDITKCLAPLLRAPDADMRAVFRLCVAASERLDGDGGWQPVCDMPGLPILMAITAAVVERNFGAYFAMERPKFVSSPYSGATYTPVSMPNGEDWLFRPVLRGMCKAESLYDGTLRIEQLAKLNDVLDVEAENQERMRAAIEKNKPK